MPGPLIAVDAPYVLYRSFFALPDSILGREGKPVNALLGAVNLLLRAAADYRPRAIVMCFGAEAASYRVELFPAYHADRPEVPDALAWQFERAPELFSAFGWGVESSPEVEADDLLGSLAAVEDGAGGRALIVTGDRDMYQCVDDHVSVLFLKSGITGFQEVDPPEVMKRYGVPPELVPDFIALRGDPSDGLPGAPGIGPKTAATLLEKYGSLDGAIAGADEQRPKVAAALTDSASELRAFRDIATLQTVSVDRPADRETDLDGGAAAARELGLGRLAQRLEDAGSLADL
ncbi:MAG TPA: 5'-3' exonuclease H3TH domain-containing protein [Solirubrobacteraceae bacterium]|jgi:DNA polymerase-1|nr:5'-3' exonuclease H3TH domain-containing protein [Solirubrobacteraceae bacterium]